MNYQPLTKLEFMYETSFVVQSTKPLEMIAIQEQIEEQITLSNIVQGECFLFIPHTTAAITINEGADPDVQGDIIAALDHMVPKNIAYAHAEGNSRSHVMASLMGSSLTIAISDRKLQLGTWQAVFFCEFDGPRTRTINCKLIPQS